MTSFHINQSNKHMYKNHGIFWYCVQPEGFREETLQRLFLASKVKLLEMIHTKSSVVIEAHTVILMTFYY